MGYAKSFKDLIVYQKARKLAKEVFEATRVFPREEMYSLTDQFRRSSRSVGAQIAEAWGKRRYEKHFHSKLTDADSEQNESQHWVQVALDCEYIPADVAQRMNDALHEIGRMLNRMMDKADLFCSPTPASIKEAPAEYFA